jgi:hypothetical protein
MEGKITTTSVEALEPGPAGEAMLWDTELKGFGVRVRAGGTRTRHPVRADDVTFRWPSTAGRLGSFGLPLWRAASYYALTLPAR